MLFVFGLWTPLLNGQNLLPNPSFEQYNDTFCGIMSPGQFTTTMEDWLSPTTASPQLFFTNIEPSCYNYQPDSQYEGPIGIKGSQLPRSGEVMAGIWVYTIEGLNQRQYIQSALESPMEVGSSYVVEFYVSLADSMEFYTDSLGAYLSMEPVFALDDAPLDYSPQVVSEVFLDEASGWMAVRDTIVANAAYDFITIGNFNGDDATNLESNPLHSGAVSTYGAYYFVDDVRVELVDDVSVDDYEPNNVFAYPTLVTDVLNVKLPPSFPAARLTIHDAFGKLVFSERIETPVAAIDMASKASGTYVLTLTSEGRTLTQRMIK